MKLLLMWEQRDNSQEIWITRCANVSEDFCGFADGDGFIHSLRRQSPSSQSGLACVQNTRSIDVK
jgi:hypothetical protein